MVGLTPESIGLSGDFKLHFLKEDLTDASIKMRTGILGAQCVKKGSVIGVGYIFYSKKLFFTRDGSLLKKEGSEGKFLVDLPLKMQRKMLYPALSLASRDQHRL